MSSLRVFRLILISATGLALMGMSSCSERMDQACQHRFPEFKQSLAVAQAEIGGAGRAIASASEETTPSRPSQDWPDWAEVRLKQVQYWIDAAEDVPNHTELRDKLNQVANQLVVFHGYAVAGESDKMHAALARTLASAEEAYRLACK